LSHLWDNFFRLPIVSFGGIFAAVNTAVLQRSGLTAQRSYSEAILQRSGHAVKSAHSPKFAAKLQHFFENKKSKAKTKSFCNKKCSFIKKNARALAYVKKKSYLCRLFLCNAQVTIIKKLKLT
jgi:hypothetical protein